MSHKLKIEFIAAILEAKDVRYTMALLTAAPKDTHRIQKKGWTDLTAKFFLHPANANLLNIIKQRKIATKRDIYEFSSQLRHCLKEHDRSRRIFPGLRSPVTTALLPEPEQPKKETKNDQKPKAKCARKLEYSINYNEDDLDDQSSSNDEDPVPLTTTPRVKRVCTSSAPPIIITPVKDQELANLNDAFYDVQDSDDDPNYTPEKKKFKII